jgi:hypothetical protein
VRLADREQRNDTARPIVHEPRVKSLRLISIPRKRSRNLSAKKRYDAYSSGSEFVRIAALLLKHIEADVSGASHTFAPWKCPQRGQYTSSHVSVRRQKLMGSVSMPVETGRPVLGHSNRIVPIVWLLFEDLMTRNREALMVNKWLPKAS